MSYDAHVLIVKLYTTWKSDAQTQARKQNSYSGTNFQNATYI